MVSSYTTNKALEKPGYNEYINSWNVPTNSDWDIVDACFAGTLSIALTSSNVTLTQANCQVMRVRLTGALSANVTIYFPSGISGFFIVQNATSNVYTVTLASSGGGTSVLCAQSQSTAVFTDGTNVFYADDTRLQLIAGTGISISSGTSPTISNTGVLSFNTRTGAVSLTSGDVTGALGYTPPTPTGTGASGTWGINVTGTSNNITAYTINQSVGTANAPTFAGVTLTGSLVGRGASFVTTSQSTTISVTDTGTSGVNIAMFGNGSTTPNKYMRVINGSWQIINSAYSAVPLTVDDSGNLTAAGNVTAYSDAKIKKNILTINDALNKVKAMRGVLYTNINTEVDGMGVIAQEMLEVCPQVVQDNNGMLSVAYGNLVGVLIEAIKELSGKVAVLENK